jgi:precorrin-6B methylase 2
MIGVMCHLSFHHPYNLCLQQCVVHGECNIFSSHNIFLGGGGGIYKLYVQVFWEIFEYSKSLVIDIDLIALYAKLAHITQNLNIFKHIRDIPFALK